MAKTWKSVLLFIWSQANSASC